MFIEFRNTNKKRQRTIEDALWFAKSYLLPRHKIDEIEIESVKDLHADGDCYDADDRSYIIRVNKEYQNKIYLPQSFMSLFISSNTSRKSLVVTYSQ